MLARLGLDLHTCGMRADRKLRTIEREQREPVPMQPMAMRRTGSVIAEFVEIVHRVAEILEAFRPPGPFVVVS